MLAHGFILSHILLALSSEVLFSAATPDQLWLQCPAPWSAPGQSPFFPGIAQITVQLEMTSQQPLSHGTRGALGANFNEKIFWIDHGELQRVSAQWIRGFIDMHQFDSLHPDQDPNIQALFKAIDAGFKTILSFKWNYSELNFPSPGSPEHAAEIQQLDRLLPIVMGKVDILVIGNEPFIEAKQKGERLNVFYETLAERVIDFRKMHSATTRLYMGSLNRLDMPAKRTPAIERFLRFIASRPELDGVDLHLHIPTFAGPKAHASHNAFEGHNAMLDYALSRIRPNQTFLCTEFSTVWHFKRHMNDAVSTHFCTKYGFPAGTKVHEVINSAIQNPMPYEQWEDFLRHESWFMDCQRFIANAIKLYRATGRLEVATYSFCPMRNRKRPFLDSDTPWMLNGVYAPSTVQLKPDGSRYENFLWAEEFRRIQRGEE